MFGLFSSAGQNNLATLSSYPSLGGIELLMTTCDPMVSWFIMISFGTVALATPSPVVDIEQKNDSFLTVLRLTTGQDIHTNTVCHLAF